MTHRRWEDRPLYLVVPHLSASSGEVPTIAGFGPGEYEVDPWAGTLRVAPGRERGADQAPALFLLDAGDEGVILAFGTEFERLPRASSESDLRARLLARAAAWQRTALKHSRQLSVLRQFVLLSDQLNRVESGGEVLEALGEHAPRIVCGSAALVFSRSDGLGGEGARWRVAHSPVPLPTEAMEIADCRLLAMAPGLVSVADPVPAAVPILEATGANALAYTGIGELEILFILERRSSRTFEAEDWYHLRLIARQAEVALNRVRAG